MFFSFIPTTEHLNETLTKGEKLAHVFIDWPIALKLG